MGRVSITYLSDSKIWACGKCGTHVTRHGDIVSKQFQGKAVAFALCVAAAGLTLARRKDWTRVFVQRHKQCQRCPPIVASFVAAEDLAGFVWPCGAPGIDDR